MSLGSNSYSVDTWYQYNLDRFGSHLVPEQKPDLSGIVCFNLRSLCLKPAVQELSSSSKQDSCRHAESMHTCMCTYVRITVGCAHGCLGCLYVWHHVCVSGTLCLCLFAYLIRCHTHRRAARSRSARSAPRPSLETASTARPSTAQTTASRRCAPRARVRAKPARARCRRCSEERGAPGGWRAGGP